MFRPVFDFLNQKNEKEEDPLLMDPLPEAEEVDDEPFFEEGSGGIHAFDNDFGAAPWPDSDFLPPPPAPPMHLDPRLVLPSVAELDARADAERKKLLAENNARLAEAERIRLAEEAEVRRAAAEAERVRIAAAEAARLAAAEAERVRAEAARRAAAEAERARLAAEEAARQAAAEIAARNRAAEQEAARIQLAANRTKAEVSSHVDADFEARYRGPINYLLAQSYLAQGSAADRLANHKLLSGYAMKLVDNLNRVSRALSVTLDNAYEENLRIKNLAIVEETKKKLNADTKLNKAIDNIESLTTDAVNFNYFSANDEAAQTFDTEELANDHMATYLTTPDDPDAPQNLVQAELVNEDEPAESRECMLPEMKAPEGNGALGNKIRIIPSKIGETKYVIKQFEDDKRFVTQAVFAEALAAQLATPAPRVETGSLFWKTSIPGQKDMEFARELVENHRFRNTKFPDSKIKIRRIDKLAPHQQEAVLLYLIHKNYYFLDTDPNQDIKLRMLIKDLGIGESKLSLLQAHYGPQFNKTWSNKETINNLFNQAAPTLIQPNNDDIDVEYYDRHWF